MREVVYESIIKNSKIAYLKINCKKDSNNKYIGIEVIEQSKEFEKVFKILTEHNILNKDITELIINNWMNDKLKEYEFNDIIDKAIKTGHEKFEYVIEQHDKRVMTDVYYLEDYFILVLAINNNPMNENKKFKILNWSKDLTGVYIDASNSMIGKRDTDLWQKSEVNQFRENEKEVIYNRNVKTLYQVITQKDGSKLYLESTIWPLVDKNNDIIGTRGLSIEINDKLVFEKTMEQNEENFREITKYSDSVFIIRDKRRATYVSPSFRHIFEEEPNDLYKDINKLDLYFKRGESDNQDINFNYDIDFNEASEGTGKIKLDNGKEKWIWYKFLPIRDTKGNVTKKVGILTDVTEKRAIEEEKNQLKLDFFANISHELRTPINLISSTIQLIKLNLNKLSQQEVKRFSKYIEIMEVNNLRMVRLINNLLDSTRINAGFVTFTPINADIIGFIEDICDSVIEYVNFHKMHLIFDTDKEEEVVLFDPDIIERAMLNLLSNAVKFNKTNGNIYVNVYTQGDEINISVKDEGIGIPKEKINCIFERFEQVQSNHKIEKQGSGIGLYLVKSLVTLHGGSISIQSEVDKGSEFIITIPKKVLNNNNKFIIKNEENRSHRANIEFSDV